MTDIRHIIESDLDGIAEIEERVFRHPWSKQQIAECLQHDKISVNLAAREGEKIVGYLFALDTGKEAQILNIAVDLPQQHRGYGQKLMKAFFTSIQEDSHVSLEVRKSNLPAIKLYSEFGFETVGEREHYYPDGEDALVMTKEMRRPERKIFREDCGSNANHVQKFYTLLKLKKRIRSATTAIIISVFRRNIMLICFWKTERNCLRI